MSDTFTSEVQPTAPRTVEGQTAPSGKIVAGQNAGAPYHPSRPTGTEAGAPRHPRSGKFQ